MSRPPCFARFAVDATLARRRKSAVKESGLGCAANAALAMHVRRKTYPFKQLRALPAEPFVARNDEITRGEVQGLDIDNIANSN